MQQEIGLIRLLQRVVQSLMTHKDLLFQVFHNQCRNQNQGNHSIRLLYCLFIGNPDMEELIVYGFYNDFKATISFPTVSKCNLRVEGLV